MERHLLSGSARTPKQRAAASTSCAFYAEHFDTVEINSTLLPRARRLQTAQGLGRADAGGLRVLAEAVPEVHAPARCSTRRPGEDPSDLDQTRTSTSSAPRSIRSRRPASWARCWRSFPPASRTSRDARGYLEWLLEAFTDYPVARRAAPPELERRSGRDTLQLLDAVRRGAGPDRRAEVQALDPPEPAARTCRRSTTCACTAGTPRSGGTTTSPRTATTTCIPPTELEPFAEAARGGVARGQEGVPLREQSLLREVGRQRRDPQAQARSAAARRISARRSSSATRT